MRSADAGPDNLNDRYSSEEKFHNQKYSNPPSGPQHYKFNPTYRIFLEMKGRLSGVESKRILEYGCGNGWVTAELASLGARVDSFDISGEAVQKTKNRLAGKNLIERCTIKKMAAESLDYPDNSFDIIFGFAILHHLDLQKSMEELYRVLKPSGYALFAEPLGDNPVLNCYRKLTPHFRTPDEQPLRLGEFRDFTVKFKKFIHNELYLTALLPFSLVYLPYVSRYFDKSLRPFIAMDRYLLRKYPRIGKWAWYTVIELQK